MSGFQKKQCAPLANENTLVNALQDIGLSLVDNNIIGEDSFDDGIPSSDDKIPGTDDKIPCRDDKH